MEDSVYRFGEFSISPSERRLIHGGQIIPYRRRPQAPCIFSYAVTAASSRVMKLHVLSGLSAPSRMPDLTNIIVLLRKPLGRDAVQTVSKSGYRFTPSVVGEPGVNQAVYAAFVRGKELLTERSLQSISTARDLFLFCVAEDPQFATAWAWLGHLPCPRKV